MDTNQYYFINKNLNILNVLKNNDYNMNREELMSFHKSLPNYKPTNLVSLKSLSNTLRLKNIYVKDESSRFGIKAFKALGASYALSKIIEKNSDPNLTFCTTTDGNHGKSLAWASKIFKRKCVVYVPQITVQARVDAIKEQGATVKKINDNYDNAVTQIFKDAKENNWIVIQDTSFEGYMEIPKLIMNGYLTTLYEIEDQLNGQRLDFVFLPAGVGTWASIAVYYFVHKYGTNRPQFVLVEPVSADCLLESMKQNKLATSKGAGDTIMAGLNCGTPAVIVCLYV